MVESTDQREGDASPRGSRGDGLKLADCAHIAEVVGAVAIVLSLIFVGLQLRESALATRTANATQAFALMSEWYSAAGNSKQGSSVFYRAITDPCSLTEQEWFQYVLNQHGVMLNLQNSYYLAREGTLDTEVHQSLTEILAGVKSQHGYLLYWQQRKAIFFQDFRAEVDAILADRVPRDVSAGLYRGVPQPRMEVADCDPRPL